MHGICVSARRKCDRASGRLQQRAPFFLRTAPRRSYAAADGMFPQKQQIGAGVEGCLGYCGAEHFFQTACGCIGQLRFGFGFACQGDLQRISLYDSEMQPHGAEPVGDAVCGKNKGFIPLAEQCQTAAGIVREDRAAAVFCPERERQTVRLLRAEGGYAGAAP